MKSNSSCLIKQKALSRKGSCRMERRSGEEQEADDASRKLAVKGMENTSWLTTMYLHLIRPTISIKNVPRGVLTV